MHWRYSRLRTAWATLGASALVASLLGVGANTATATVDTPDETSKASVCINAARADRGFTDVPQTHTFKEAINCLAHYGITVGTTPSTFSPDLPVNRWQMMLFLKRATIPANIRLRTAQPQNFTDVGNLIPEAREAIDLLVTNGIATPAAAGRFNPNGIVDRAEMALLLTRLLAAAGSVVSYNTGGDILLDSNGDGIQSQPDDYFQDARASVPVNTDKAISASYELGITTGTDRTPTSGAAQPGLDFYYRPRGSVTRGQMAAFIIRTLGHTLARPKGVSAQYSGSEIRVSVRDQQFRPVRNAPIDLFYVRTADEARAFDASHACATVEFLSGSYRCEIDTLDLVTDERGEVLMAVPPTVASRIATTVWVWTGANGAKVSSGTDLVRLDIRPSAQPRVATQARISTSFKGSKARFGTTVTFTVQLQDSEGRDIAAGADGRRPAQWEFVEQLMAETGTPNGTQETGETLFSKTSKTVTSDSSGRFTFSISVADPDSASTGQSRTRTYGLTAGTNAPPTFTAARAPFDEAHFLVFDDSPSTPASTVVTLTTPQPYITVPSSGAVGNAATVTAFDEYGVAAARATAGLSSTKSTISSQTFLVGGNGTHRFSYIYSGTGGTVETLTATIDPDGNASTSNNITSTAHMFWAAPTAITSTNTTKKAILFGNVARKEIIVDTNDAAAGSAWPLGAAANNPATVPEAVAYDSNDRFDVQGTNDAAPVPSRMEDFERALAKYLATPPTTAAGRDGCLEWRNYDPLRPREVAEFRLWSTGCPS